MYGLFYETFELRMRHGPDPENVIPCFEAQERNIAGKHLRWDQLYNLLQCAT
jgi:hypothetical protein